MEEKPIQEETDPLTGFFQYIPPVLNTLTKSSISVSLLQGQDTPLLLTSIFPPTARSQNAPLCAGSSKSTEKTLEL